MDEAYAILVKYHAEGDENSEFVKAECTEIKEALEAELKVGQMNEEILSSQHPLVSLASDVRSD